MNTPVPPDDRPSEGAGAYRVLARKYRPKTFADLIGQDALVRTLTNAIASGRLAQGYMLTGVRGVGKTTTARLIARALNCVGPDGTGGPTPNPCGVCANCVAISEDRHVDVLEMDAASRTGIDDIRELLEGVRYRPVSARYKIYIVDEVHMLSEKAFNALLKTLEEPPEHVKFIFATTEIRKVPVTVLSRCQRFDLRRIDMAHLVTLFRDISGAKARMSRTARWRSSHAPPTVPRATVCRSSIRRSRRLPAPARRASPSKPCAICLAWPTAPRSSTCSRR